MYSSTRTPTLRNNWFPVLTLTIKVSPEASASLIIYDVAWCHEPEDYNTNFHGCENLRSPLFKILWGPLSFSLSYIVVLIVTLVTLS